MGPEDVKKLKVQVRGIPPWIPGSPLPPAPRPPPRGGGAEGEPALDLHPAGRREGPGEPHARGACRTTAVPGAPAKPLVWFSFPGGSAPPRRANCASAAGRP